MINTYEITIKPYWIEATGKNYLEGKVLIAEMDAIQTPNGPQFSGFYRVDDNGRPWFVHQSRVIRLS